jgi:phosphoribosylformylglycinamidine synthase
MPAVNVLILCGYGLNCDHETAYAFALAGADARRVHINALIDGSVTLDDFQIMAFIGGFSWADDHGAGVIEALRLKTHIGDKILGFVAQGKLVIGICNGFQALVNLGLLPGFEGDDTRRCVALTWNDCGNFRDEWVRLQVNAHSPCVFTRGLERLELPVRHGEGKFVAEADICERLDRSQQIVLRYALADGRPAEGRFPSNPNGSLHDIAGICDPTGRVFGLMPHPEAFNHWTNHPDWARTRVIARRQGRTPDDGPTPGVRLLQNGVAYVQQS